MKKLILTIGLVVASLSLANAQGLIKIYNASTGYMVSTNGGPATTSQGLGRTATTANQFYYALLVDPTAPASGNPTNSYWTQALQMDDVTPVTATNYTALAGALIGYGGTSGAGIYNWAYATAQYVELVGWSSNLGSSWSTVLGELTSGNFNLSSGTGYYLGASPYGSVTSSSSGTVPAVTIFSAGGVSAGFDLNYIPVPEPSIIALAGLGGLSLLLFRRRK